VVERGSHYARGQSTQAKSPQRVEERLQLWLVFLDDVIRPIILLRHKHLAGEVR
jgi:hypothetical protein